MGDKIMFARMREICMAPAPEGKEEFFRKMKSRGLTGRQPAVMTHGEFLACQFTYIEKWVWVLSGLLLLFMIWVFRQDPGNAPFALTPLLAAGVLAETGRSRRWKMAELEKAARFSLRSILLARMFLVGLADTAGLLAVTAAVRQYLPYSLLRVFLYMMVPYLSASFLGSLYERKMKTDTIFGSLAICAVSSALFAAAPFIFRSLYGEEFVIVWAGAFVLLAAGLGSGLREYINETEETVWN